MRYSYSFTSMMDEEDVNTDIHSELENDLAHTELENDLAANTELEQDLAYFF